MAEPSREAVIQDVASEAVEVSGADAVVERRLRRVFACAAIVAGVGITGAVSGILTLGPSKGRGAQTLGTLAARDAGASIAAVEAAASLGVIFTRGASKALQEYKNLNLFMLILSYNNDYLQALSRNPQLYCKLESV